MPDDGANDRQHEQQPEQPSQPRAVPWPRHDVARPDTGAVEFEARGIAIYFRSTSMYENFVVLIVHDPIRAAFVPACRSRYSSLEPLSLAGFRRRVLHLRCFTHPGER